MNHVKKVCVIFALLIIFFKAKNFCSNVQVSNKFFLVLDNQLSENLTRSITEFINKELVGLKPQEFNKKLKEKFPVIKSVIITRTNPKFLSVKIKIHEPLCQINDDKILSQNACVFDKEHFNNNFSGLETIQVKENFDKPELLNELRKIFYVNFNQDFSIEWLNKNKIILVCKDLSNLYIVIKHDKLPDVKTVQLCRKLYQEYLQAKKNKKIKNIVFDLRFTEQIILSEN